MIAGNDRLIVVLGMAHSGTTILTHILRQHPEVTCFVDGSEAWILENTLLPGERSEDIGRLLDRTPNRVLLKRPWNTVHHADWMCREMHAARFLYSLRSFDAVAASWRKPTSLVDSWLRDGTYETQRGFYDLCLSKAGEFARKVANFHIVPHEELLRNPTRTIAELGAWLGLSGFAWDVSAVSTEINIKDRLRS